MSSEESLRNLVRQIGVRAFGSSDVESLEDPEDYFDLYNDVLVYEPFVESLDHDHDEREITRMVGELLVELENANVISNEEYNNFVLGQRAKIWLLSKLAQFVFNGDLTEEEALAVAERWNVGSVLMREFSTVIARGETIPRRSAVTAARQGHARKRTLANRAA